MLSESDLRLLLADLESDRVERTISTSDTGKFSKAVCAFANDMPRHQEPGFLFIGVDDNGVPSGVTITDQLLQNLAGLRADGNILPVPSLAVWKQTLDGKDIAVVRVLPSDLPPVRYNGQVWIRVGPRRATASEQEERVLTERRIAHARSFDATPVRDATIDDLSFSQFAAYRQRAVSGDVIDENHRDLPSQLGSLRFFDPSLACPTVAGILLFGTNPRYFLPGSYVQFLELPGSDLTDLPLREAEISGDLLSVLMQLDIRAQSIVDSVPIQRSVLQEGSVANYPAVALRELLMNAVMHRDYQSNTPTRFYCFSDRIEIQSPGGLYGEVTRETLSSRNSYRNPILAEAMKTLGYVNRYGYGIQRAQAALAKNGNPPAEFEALDNVFMVTIRAPQQ